MNKGTLASIGIILSQILILTLPVAAWAKPSDVRIIVDISGSMQKNDPDNLRQPAVRLITNLLPGDSKAGVWTFAQFVNMLVPHKPTTDAWKSMARSESSKINSVGLRTNIGGALEKASADWGEPNHSQNRHIILLTDGMVDIARNSELNAAERARILSEVLPKISRAGARIHTIALSDNADQELLSILSNRTNGYHRIIDNPAQLQKEFLKILEQSAPRDSVPIRGNKFKIDRSISETTILVFHEVGSKATRLMTPAGNQISKNTDRKDIEWYGEPGYDLITINQPKAGDWQILASEDPDNRVMIVSDMKLNVSALPSISLANENFSISASLEEQGKTIRRSDFLDLVEFRLEINYPDGGHRLVAMTDDGREGDKKPADGVFTAKFPAESNTGPLALELTTQSPTFQRARAQSIQISGTPVDTRVALANESAGAHSLEITPKKDLVMPDSMRISAEIRHPDGKISSADPRPRAGEIFNIELPKTLDGGQYEIRLTVSGKTLSGRKFNMELNPQVLSTPPSPELKPEEPKPEPEPEQKSKADPEPEAKPDPESPKPEKAVDENAKQTPSSEDKPKKKTSKGPKIWIWVSVGVFNLLVLVGAFFLLRRFTQKTTDEAEEMTEEMEE